jgi:hypothetical protein
MPAELRLQPNDARLVFLALAYHLARPGSELDPETKMPVEHGLAEVSSALQPQLRQAVASITLSAYQLQRLGFAMLGSVNELKVYPMLEARPPDQGGGRRSTVPGFDQTLRHLFPQVEEDAEEVLAIAEQMVMLKRRIDRATEEAQASEEPAQPPATGEGRAPQRWWQLFRRRRTRLWRGHR